TMSKRSGSASKINSFFKFSSRSKETSLHDTLRLDSARPTDPIDAHEIVQQLIPGSNSLQSRLRTLEELNGIITKYPFQHTSELWVAVEDLLEAGVPHRARKTVWSFMIACIHGQFEDLGMLRAVFYQAINKHEIWEDFDDKLQALKELTNDGRDVYGFEKNIVRLLSHWVDSSFEQAKVAQHIKQQRVGMQKSTTSLPASSSTPHLILLTKPIPHLEAIMALLINVVRFNFVFFEEDEIAGLLQLLYTICINAPEDIPHTIGFLDVIVRYGFVPAVGLPTFLKILCHITMMDPYRDKAWTITLNLLKSHSAHGALRILCQNLRPQDTQPLTPTQMRTVQGSIQLLERSVWGPMQIDGLSFPYTTVLWSMKSCLSFHAFIVNCDILASITRLLRSRLETLGDLEFEIVMEIMEKMLEKLEPEASDQATIASTTTTSILAGSQQKQPFIFGTKPEQPGDVSPYQQIIDNFGQLLFLLVDLYKAHDIPSVTKRLMQLLSRCQAHLPEDTLILLLEYYHTDHSFYPYTANWLDRLREMVQRSVLQETRPNVRLKALTTAIDVYQASVEFFHEDIVRTIFLDIFDTLPQETNVELAGALTTLLIDSIKYASDDLFTVLLDRIVQIVRCQCTSKQSHHYQSQQQAQQSSHTQSSTMASVSSPHSFLASKLGMTSNSSSSSSQTSTAHTTGGGGQGGAGGGSGAGGRHSRSHPCLPQAPTPHAACQSLRASVGIIDLFQLALYDPNGSSRADDLFRLLVSLSINQDVHQSSRLVMLNLLLCLRVDLDHRIYCEDPKAVEEMVAIGDVLPGTDDGRHGGGASGTGSSGGGSGGGRTGTSRHGPSGLRQQANMTAEPTASASTTSTSTTATTATATSFDPSTQWKLLKHGRTVHASPYVISYLEIASTTDDSMDRDESLPAPLVGCAKMILNIPLYMTGVLSILQQEKDWQVYTFLMQRLGIQLFNKHLFCNSADQIKQLHQVLMGMTVKDKVPEGFRNLPVHVRRNTLHILAYRVLVILLCYHSKLTMQEQHDLVHAFVVGLQRQATCAKICIHALVLCCFELPQSMTKHLPATVLRLSQIMSTATISVHILEFLSTVARLPALYANFVESDYKRVFGIALKYIQYTHSVSQQNAASSSSPGAGAGNASSQQQHQQSQTCAGARALPQYVLIMAYQVIDIWFMLQRLQERRKYVPYVVRNLLMANENSKKLDEQTEVCLDMLARYSYANCEPKPRPSLTQKLLMKKPDGKSSSSSLALGKSATGIGRVHTKTWIQGNAFISVQTSQNLGWAEIT
ncbi:Tuberous sclerosis 2-like protein, partial [Actinomortierella ambigua]